MKELETLAEGRFLRLVKSGTWEFVQRKNITGIVGIVAVTEDRKLILVEQYRPPVDKRVIEIPAGLVGDVAGKESELLVEAAKRELEEETGYQAREIVPLAVGTASAGMSDEVITLLKANGLTRVGNGGGDGSEQIVVHEV
ncbi:MAG: NUDIX hydrolase, partial [Bacillota bacterium]